MKVDTVALVLYPSGSVGGPSMSGELAWWGGVGVIEQQ